jgi:hypothetical protein
MSIIWITALFWIFIFYTNLDEDKLDKTYGLTRSTTFKIWTMFMYGINWPEQLDFGEKNAL